MHLPYNSNTFYRSGGKTTIFAYDDFSEEDDHGITQQGGL